MEVELHNGIVICQDQSERIGKEGRATERGGGRRRPERGVGKLKLAFK